MVVSDMEIGGTDLILDGPTHRPGTLDFILDYWKSLWRTELIDVINDTEVMVWRNSWERDNDHYEGLVHILIFPDQVTLVVETTMVEYGNECLSKLLDARNQGLEV